MFSVRFKCHSLLKHNDNSRNLVLKLKKLTKRGLGPKMEVQIWKGEGDCSRINNFVVATLLESVGTRLRSYVKVCVIYVKSYAEV